MPHPINVVFEETFLPYVLGLMPHSQFGKKVKMPEKSGVNVKWSRMSVPQAQTTPLQEDVDPTPILPSRTDLEATVVEYGARVRKSGWLDLTEVNQQNSELMEWLMDTFALTIDELDKQMLATTASTVTCSSGSGTATDLNATDLDTVVQTLMNQDAEPITSMMKAATGQGTTPLMPSYVGIINTALWKTLKAVAGFREVKNYASQGDLYEGEIGATDRIRWIGTSRGYVSSSTYRLPILGKNAYGSVKIPGGEKLLGFKTPEQANSEMNRYSVVYWLSNYVSRILNDLNIITVICTAAS
jgi:N4-gp56 family major capsid protein